MREDRTRSDTAPKLEAPNTQNDYFLRHACFNMTSRYTGEERHEKGPTISQAKLVSRSFSRYHARSAISYGTMQCFKCTGITPKKVYIKVITAESIGGKFNGLKMYGGEWLSPS